jgi:hypothetical protein
MQRQVNRSLLSEPRKTDFLVRKITFKIRAVGRADQAERQNLSGGGAGSRK